MFFICGINQEQKDLGSFGPYICGACGSYGRYQVYITYMCLSLFFIPIFKWSKKYYVQTTCCQSLYELDPEIGKRIQRGEPADIRPGGHDSDPAWNQRLSQLAESTMPSRLPGLRV